MKSVMVYDDTEKMLEELAEKYGVPVAEILEIILPGYNDIIDMLDESLGEEEE